MMMMMMMISKIILQNYTEKLAKMTYLTFTILGCYCRPRCYISPTGKNRCYKITTNYK